MPAEGRPNERLVIESTAERKLEAIALRAFLKATDLLGLSVGKVIADWREKQDPLLEATATISELRVRLAATERKLALVQARLDRVAPRQRPHFTPTARFDVLEIKTLLRESAAATADWCRVAVNTVLRWEEEQGKHPERKTIGSLLKASPPVRRFADAERRLVQWMDRLGFPGSETIVRTLARAGRKISARTVARIRKEKPLVVPPSPSAGHVVKGRYPNHVWIADETEIPALFRIFSFRLLVILDAFSRFPVAARLSITKPTAHDMVSLFRKAIANNGRPRHFVTDKGRPFRTKLMARELRRHRIQQRFGAIGQHGSIALIERLFKTLKYNFSLRHAFTLSRVAVERRLNLVLIYYAYLRPHQSLRGATPAEVYFRIPPAHLTAVPPPRGRPGDMTEPPPFNIVHLDDERRLPLLVPKAA